MAAKVEYGTSSPEVLQMQKYINANFKTMLWSCEHALEIKQS